MIVATMGDQWTAEADAFDLDGEVIVKKNGEQQGDPVKLGSLIARGYWQEVAPPTATAAVGIQERCPQGLASGGQFTGPQAVNCYPTVAQASRALGDLLDRTNPIHGINRMSPAELDAISHGKYNWEAALDHGARGMFARNSFRGKVQQLRRKWEKEGVLQEKIMDLIDERILELSTEEKSFIAGTPESEVHTEGEAIERVDPEFEQVDEGLRIPTAMGDVRSYTAREFPATDTKRFERLIDYSEGWEEYKRDRHAELEADGEPISAEEMEEERSHYHAQRWGYDDVWSKPGATGKAQESIEAALQPDNVITKMVVGGKVNTLKVLAIRERQGLANDPKLLAKVLESTGVGSATTADGGLRLWESKRGTNRQGWQMTGLDEDKLADWATTIDQAVADRPKLAAAIEKFGQIDTVVVNKFPTRFTGFYDGNTERITLSEKDSKEGYEQGLGQLRNNSEGNEFLTDPTTGGLITHEYGHHIHLAVSNQHHHGSIRDNELTNIVDSMTKADRKRISGYSASDPVETVAESFAAWAHPKFDPAMYPDASQALWDYFDAMIVTEETPAQ